MGSGRTQRSAAANRLLRFVALAETPEVFRDGVAVLLGHRLGDDRANLVAALPFLDLAANLQLELFEQAEHLAILLLQELGVAGETGLGQAANKAPEFLKVFLVDALGTELLC